MRENTLLERTIAYYDKNVASFTKRSLEENVDDARNLFMQLLPPKAKILEAGCGPGRDIKFFLQQGFSVTAFDASEEMCKIAEANTGISVDRKRFDQIDAHDEYHGVWASASLLHVPLIDQIPMFRLIERSLKQDGFFYCSFKYGMEERISKKSGRHFTYMNEAELHRIVKSVPLFLIEHMWVSCDTRDHRKAENWLKIILRKKGEV